MAAEIANFPPEGLQYFRGNSGMAVLWMKAVKLQGQAHEGLCPPDEGRLQVERVAKQLQDSAADDDGDETGQIQKKRSSCLSVQRDSP